MCKQVSTEIYFVSMQGKIRVLKNMLQDKEALLEQYRRRNFEADRIPLKGEVDALARVIRYLEEE